MADRSLNAPPAEDKKVDVVVLPGRTVLVAKDDSVKRAKVAAGVGVFEERTVSVDHERHGAGALLKLVEKEAQHLVDRGFVKRAE